MVHQEPTIVNTVLQMFVRKRNAAAIFLGEVTLFGAMHVMKHMMKNQVVIIVVKVKWMTLMSSRLKNAQQEGARSMYQVVRVNVVMQKMAVVIVKSVIAKHMQASAVQIIIYTVVQIQKISCVQYYCINLK